MSEDLQPFATSGSGKSEAEVAFELVSKLKGQGVWGERNMADILDMFAECLDAAKGLRSYEGQNRVNAPINAQSFHSAAPAQNAAPIQAAQVNPAPNTQMQAAQIQAAQIEAQRQQAAQMQQQQHAQMQQQAQPVHVQQQAVAQAFKG